MKLTLKQLQTLDIILKDTLLKNNISSKFNFVIRINNDLWTGDFVDYDENLNYIKKNGNGIFLNCNETISHHLDYMSYEKNTRFKYFSDNINKYINSYSLPLVLINLLDEVNLDELVFNKIQLPPVLLNAKQLTNDISSIEYLYLDDEIEYEVVSIIESK